MKSTTTKTAYLIGLSAKVLTCTVTWDPESQVTCLAVRDNRDGWERDLMVRVRQALAWLCVPGGFRISFDHKPPTNARPDLAIVAACLKAAGREVYEFTDKTLYLGWLTTSGDRFVQMRGVLPILETVEGFTHAFVGAPNAIEAGANTNRITCVSLSDVHDLIDPASVSRKFAPSTMDQWEPCDNGTHDYAGLSVKAIELLDRAVQSESNVLVVGANAWKAAKIFYARLPRLSGSEARAIACVQSAAGLLTDGKIPSVRPFRAPHHSVALRGLVGSFEHPGEISLAHYGTLVLDHVLQFKRDGLSCLKGAMRAGITKFVRGSNGERVVEWPAKCRIVATVYPDELRFLTPERLDFLGNYVRVDL